MEEKRGFAGKEKNGVSSIPAAAVVSSHASGSETCAEGEKGAVYGPCRNQRGFQDEVSIRTA